MWWISRAEFDALVNAIKLINSKLDGLNLLMKQGKVTQMGIAEDVAALVKEVETQTTVTGSVEVLLGGLVETIEALKTQLASSADPAVQAALSSAIAAIESNTSRLSDAVSKNTPAA